jgi:RNA-directed DNA polymerase
MSDQNWHGRQHRFRDIAPGGRRSNLHYARRRRRRDQRTIQQVRPTNFDQLTAVENLVRIFEVIRREKGQAPGIDGIRYDDLSRREVYEIARQVSRALRQGRYRPHPARLRRIPKSDRRSYRTLRLRVIFDRVIATALTEMVTPLVDSIFLPRNYGFRPRVGPWDMLADMAIDAVVRNCWVNAIDDVANAFDNVLIALVIAALRHHLADEQLLTLAETILKGGKPDKQIKIDQGSAFSPLGLNILLHHVLDILMTQDPPLTLWYRYADNLVYLCQSVSEGNQILDRIRNLLHPTGLTLKGKDGPPADLRAGQTKQVLGLTVRHKDGQMQFDLGSNTWKNLSRTLVETHRTNTPPTTARSAVRGWIQSYGPAFRNTATSDISDQILREAATHGFQEIATEQEIHEWMSDAHRSWEELLARKRRERQDAHARPGTAPPATVTPAVSL